jgi:hypothetical protein
MMPDTGLAQDWYSVGYNVIHYSCDESAQGILEKDLASEEIMGTESRTSKCSTADIERELHAVDQIHFDIYTSRNTWYFRRSNDVFAIDTRDFQSCTSCIIVKPLDYSSTTLSCPSPCGDDQANSCLQSSERLEQEAAGYFVLALVDRAWQVNCLAVVSEQAADDIAAVGELGIDLLGCMTEPGAELQASANTAAVAVEIVTEETIAGPSAVASAAV